MLCATVGGGSVLVAFSTNPNCFRHVCPYLNATHTDASEWHQLSFTKLKLLLTSYFFLLNFFLLFLLHFIMSHFLSSSSTFSFHYLLPSTTARPFWRRGTVESPGDLGWHLMPFGLVSFPHSRVLAGVKRRKAERTINCWP